MKEVKVEQLPDHSILVTYQRGDGTFFTSNNNFHEKYGFKLPPQDHVARTKASYDAAKAELDRMEAEAASIDPSETFDRPLMNDKGVLTGETIPANKLEWKKFSIETQRRRVEVAEKIYLNMKEAFDS